MGCSCWVDTLPLSHNCPQENVFIIFGKKKEHQTEDLSNQLKLGKLQNWADYFESSRSPGVRKPQKLPWEGSPQVVTGIMAALLISDSASLHHPRLRRFMRGLMAQCQCVPS